MKMPLWVGGLTIWRGFDGQGRGRVFCRAQFIRLPREKDRAQRFRQDCPLILDQPSRTSMRGRRGLAQLVEHRSPKPRVVGSSPSAPAMTTGQTAKRARRLIIALILP